jgi:hypothetical protein
MHPRSSICGLFSLAALLLSPLRAPLRAQTHKVEATEKVTRAIGVYEWTGELPKPSAARLIPVSLFINGHFEDAGVYLAQPVPFALQTGDIYSIERAGQAIGTLDLEYARNITTRHSAADDNPLGAWFGYGRFLSPAEEAKATRLHASAKPPVIVATDDSKDDRPKFVRRQPSSTTSTTTKPSAPSTKPSSSTPDEDPDRPTLRHRDPADTTRQKKNSTKELGYVSPPNTSLNDDPNRPNLHRGVPAGAVTTTQLTGTPPNLHQAVAVSDPASHDPHPFAREWATSTERAETLAAIEALAQPRLATYIATNKLTAQTATRPVVKSSSATRPATRSATLPKKSAPNHHHPHPASQKAAAPPPVPLTSEEIYSYTLSYGGLPTFIYTAESPIPNGGPVYITLVAQRLPSGELQVALSSVTDASHLNRTPWFRLVDVVDPDWSHRASLLFELRAQSSRQFALYRLITAQAEQTFVTGIIE